MFIMRKLLFFLLAISTLLVADVSISVEAEKAQMSIDKASVDFSQSKLPPSNLRPDIPFSGKKGKPMKRITVGAPRGNGLNLELSIYIPEDHIFLESLPTLYWEVSEAVDTPVQSMLVKNGQDEPVLNNIITHSADIGRHAVDLRNYEINLMPGIEYEWSIRLCSTSICSAASKDIIARTYFFIQRAPPQLFNDGKRVL